MQTLKKARVASFAAVLFACIVGLSGCSQSSTSGTTSGSSASSANPSGATANVIKIGVDLPLSGADASDGVPTQNGVKLAVIDANKRNLVPGFTLQANILDDAVNGVHDPSQGVKNVQALANDAAVLGIVGPFNSNVAKAEIPQSNSMQIALVAPSTTNDTLTRGPEAAGLRRTHPDQITFFRVCATDSIQGPAGATYEYRTLKLRRAYVIDDNETYGKGVADEWAATFQKLGGTILGHDHITKGQQDFHALLTRAGANHPDVVFYGGTTSTGGGLVRKQMGDVGLGSVTFAGADGIRNDEFLKIAGSTANDVYATVASVNAATLPAAKSFLSDYQAQFNQPVGSYSAAGYASAMVLIQAITAATKANGGKMPTRDQVLAQLRNAKSFNSIMGTFSFDANGDTTNKIISIYEAVNDQWKFVTQQSFAGAQ